MNTTIITAIHEDIPGVKTFTLSYENGDAIAYAAGQFITFSFTHHGREERRSYSITSCAALGEPLSFTVKRLDNGAYSRMLIDRGAVGDRLYTTGVAGLFTLPEDTDTYEQVFFFAAGIGITPIFSLIHTLLLTQPDKRAVLIYSNRSKEEVVFYSELNELATRYADRFVIEYLFSISFDLARARLNKQLLPILLKEYGQCPKERMLFYICGPFAYMRMAIFSLEELGIKGGQIKRENFNTNDRQITKAKPPDEATRQLTLKVRGAVYNFPVQYPDTILEAAKKHGIALPYSCEVGRCGSCAAMCISGNVWLSYNEVLMDGDLKKGTILTCVGHPVGGDVVIEI
jgi:ferredoxin-NADP reductase